MKKTIRADFLVMTALLSGLSVLLMCLDFPVPFVPPYVKMDFSDLPVVLGGFLWGIPCGAIIAVLKILLNFVLTGTYSMGVGELANLTGSLCYMIPAVFLYRRFWRSRKGAVLSLTAGTVIVSAAIVLGDLWFFFPAYGRILGLTEEALIASGHAVNPAINSMAQMMAYSLLPFNLLKYGLVSALAYVLYKRLKRLTSRQEENL